MEESLRITDGQGSPEQAPGPGATAYIYACISGGKDSSIDGQIATLTEYAQERKWKVADIFKDALVSGPPSGLMRLLALTQRKPRLGDVVLLWDYSSLITNENHSAFWNLVSLRARGWYVHDLRGRVPAIRSTLMCEAVIQWQQTITREQLQAATVRGIHDLAEHGYLPGGRPPLGYYTVKEALYPRENKLNGSARYGAKCYVDENLRPLIVRAFEMRAGGHTNSEIIEAAGLTLTPALLAKGSGNTTKNLPVSSQWDRLFRNKAYIGILSWGGVEYEHVMPRIVDDEVWQRVHGG